MGKKFWAALMLVLLLVSSSFALNLQKHVKYTLYIGLNDGRTGKQTYDQSEARRIFENIAGKYVDGYTIYDAEGFWHEGEIASSEKTLVCVIVDASEEAIRKIMDEALKLFRQNTILVERGETMSEFYNGNK